MPHYESVSTLLYDHWMSITYAALQRTTVYVISIKLADSHGSILVSVHLHKGKATIRLEACLCDITKVVEERDKIVLGGVWSKIADIAGSLPLRSL